ncbi:uncharacterized protein ASPGLDRAFT_69236 [Aspergillus glaucus CBS 516.65]|uniref:Uncharacterized protein n=1 Tax=Aspergillus glaucus CBS 516.65 TaxID=1160497 RepID=A0A1L9VA67_ASPGL|nr:hypothetical protein ASPGLDRAFT_69236 [Aspergillus glaucus CBS 516.65]OJJ80793.1 hypothetical protein ASPGLDRAFT_69236 [Aspergillus glaucus CBS 516.65]
MSLLQAFIFHEMMRIHNVKHVFGYPGGTILPVFDAIYSSQYFDFIFPKHEQGAGHMAEGYARASGKPGVVLVTSGPSATNAITPIQNALCDGAPLVVFCGQVATSAIGSDAFQEADILGISRACTKWNIMVKHTSELLQRINEAFEIAMSGRPVPVLVDLPRNITAGVLWQAVPAASALPSLPEMQAQTPQELADKASIPVTTTLQGLGAFDKLDKKSLRILGMHGSAYANMSMQKADLIIALGARFDDRVTLNIQKFAPAAKAIAANGCGGIVHFEIMPKNINKVVQATEAVVGDISENATHLLPLVKKTTMCSEERSHLIKPQYLIEQLSNLTADHKHETIIATGVGQHQMWTAQHQGGSARGPLVIDIDGYASFAMTLTEMSTAAQFNIGVKVIILNNEEQGMVTQWQNLFYEDRYAHTHQQNPNFMEFAKEMRIQHRRISKPGEVTDALTWLINTDGPSLLEVVTDKKVPVFPMVPAGSGLREFIAFDAEQDKQRRDLMRQRTSGLHGE